MAIAVPARADGVLVDGTIAAVERHAVLRLESGTKVRLHDVLVPQIPEPYGFEAYARMKELLVGEGVMVQYMPDVLDRFGVPNGMFTLKATGESVAHLLVREGLARVRPRSVFGGDFLDDEAAARAAGRGLWSLETYAVRNPAPDALAQDMESFQIIEGIVTDTRRMEDVTFVNFGSDWRTDTTAVVKNVALDTREVEHTALPGARVQVRGFVEMVNGPSVWVEHPDAFRILD